MPIRKIVFRVLLSSPSDLQAERRIVECIINEISEANKFSGFDIELVCWENDVSPNIALKSGQVLIDKTFDYENSDLLIGIFYKKLGSPVLGADSGTIHEIEEAIESYKKQNKPDIMLYFKSVSLKLGESSKEERDAYEKVEQKRKEFMELGIVQKFETSKEFERLFRKHITRFFDLNTKRYSNLGLLSDKTIIIKTRAEFERMEEIVKEATHDIYILGINLECAINMADLLALKASKGVSVHLLALNPNCPAIEYFNINNIDTEYRRNKIITNLNILRTKLKQSENINIRLLDRIFVAGCTGIDIEKCGGGRIVAQHYLNNVGTARAPILDIYSDYNSDCFITYQEYLLKMWDAAEEY